MPEFLTLQPPDEARDLLFRSLPDLIPAMEVIQTDDAIGRVTAEPVLAPHPLPAFPRSTVDGYAVRSRDTHGASDSLPGYLALAGEIPMGAQPQITLARGQCALIHTGGMLPAGADAVVMLEYTQVSRAGEIEIQRSAAVGENVIKTGEDVTEGQVVIPAGKLLRPAEIGGLMALGITTIRVAKKPVFGILSSGDEVIPACAHPQPGQVRDINSHTLAALIRQAGGVARSYGIIQDDFNALKHAAEAALKESDALIITAGSSASTRDMTAEVIASLGKPGVLVHGINTRPGKPTILGVCAGKAVIGLPGNPVSALVNGMLFVVPLVRRLQGLEARQFTSSVQARLTLNLASQAGREDWQAVRLIQAAGREWQAEPVFGKSNLIFSLAAADGLIKIPPDATGLAAGEMVDVYLME